MMGSTILVVEDEALIADDLQRTLIRFGYKVPVTAATGREAIAAVSKERPGLALMDIKLQGSMDGIEAATILRRDFDVPVVYLTSNSDEATQARAMATGPSGYLLKPFSDKELKIAIEVAIHKHAIDSKLVQREQWFSTTLESIGDGVIATDEKDAVTFMNAVAERLTGWTAADASGRPLSEVLHLVGSDGVVMRSPLKVAVAEGAPVDLPPETTLVRRDGSRLAVEDSAAPIVDAKGTIRGGVLVFRDITERKKMEQRLVQSERLASLGTLAAGMGHEINNPLMTVLGNLEFANDFVQTLKSELGEPAAARLSELEVVLGDANGAANRVREIVLVLKKFISNEPSVLATLDLSAVLDAAAKMTTNTVRHHARLIKSYGTTPLIQANEGELVQVFTNLIVNASHAIVDGQAEQNEIRLVTYTNEAGQAVAEVRDTGCGIAPALLPRLFEPFFTTKSGGAGMGLGLAITHSLVTSIGGEIVVESELEKGTTFRVTLPVGSAHDALAPFANTREAPASRRGRILVIDDEEALGRSIARSLRAEHDVTLVTSGEDALAKLAAGEIYDAIFCDLMMPSMSGVDLYERLDLTNPEQAKRIVFMTGGAFTERTQAFLESTGNIVIAKPFTPQTARKIAREWLKQ